VRFFSRLISLALLGVVAGCDVATRLGGIVGNPQFRVVNAFTVPVDVLVDGNVVISALTPGSVTNGQAAPGNHTLVIRTGGSTTSQPLASAVGAMSTIAAIRSSTGALSSAVLDDTTGVVAPNSTELRILNFAPNAGTLQVYRTQPDASTPAAWQSAFDYNSDPSTQAAPFVQSTVGSWNIRVWKTPADASGWTTAPTKLILPLASGEKATVMILDQPTGGVRLLQI